MASNRPAPSLGERLRDFWVGEVDLAPLGLFRIVYGILLFNWFWQLGPYLRAFFTEEGVLPRRSLFTFFQDRFSLLYLVGDWWQVLVVWLLSLLVAILLTIGYRTRLACGLAFLAVISFEQRNPLMLDGSDFVFRAIPFWLLFSAAGDRFSVDAALRRSRGETVTGAGPALPIRILQLQVGWIHLATGLEKLAGKAWLDGTAAYYALQLKHTYGRAYAEGLVQIEPFIRAATWGTLAVELGFLPAVFFPLVQPYSRYFGVAAAASLHCGILALMNVGNFPVIMLASLIIFLPPKSVTGLIQVGRHLFAGSRLRMYYDENCEFCRRTAAFIRAADIYGTIECAGSVEDDRARVGSAEADSGKGIRLLDKRGRLYTGFAAYARAGAGIPLLFPIAIVGLLPLVSRLAARAYDRFAQRASFIPGCPGPAGSAATVAHTLPKASAGTSAWRALRRAALVLIACAVFATALSQNATWGGLWPPVVSVLRFGSLDQRWDMFSPDPARSDGWMRAPGRLADGTVVDLMDDWGRPRPRHPVVLSGPTNEGPRSSDPLYTRWVKVHERLATASYSEYRLEYGRMYCRLRNLHLAPPDSALETFDLLYTERIIQPPGQGPPVTRDHHLWQHQC